MDSHEKDHEIQELKETIELLRGIIKTQHNTICRMIDAFILRKKLE